MNQPDESVFKAIAAQLRQPHGENAAQVGLKMNEGNKYINLKAIETVDPKSGDRILEIGMGNGFFVKDILARHPSIKYTGCDLSEEMVDEAIKFNTDHIRSGNAEFKLSDAGSLPFPENTFDKVFTVNTIYFWDDRSLVLSGVKNVLKPGGLFVIALRPRFQMENYPFVKYGFNLFSAEEVKELLIENNFNNVETCSMEEPFQVINGQNIPVSTVI
ncbi:MAG: class I SAM-dependent methyltransferase, partial [Sphingobacteriales bacterium]